MSASQPTLAIKQADGSLEVLYDATPKQLEFHSRSEPNVVYLGSRGTGKSLALRMEAHMRALAYPKFSYAIIRRTYPELLKSHLNFIEEEMRKLGGSFHRTNRIATYSNGSKGYFSHVADDADLGNLLSAEFYWLGADELSTIPWQMFRKLAASVRVPKNSGLVALTRASTNPIGVSADKINAYYVTHEVSPDDDPDYIPADWHAVTTTLKDNPYLDEQQYRKQFSGLPAHVRKAWLDGEFVIEGAYFVLSPDHFTDEPPRMFGSVDAQGFVIPAPNIYRAVDWGTHDAAVALWIAVYANGRAIVFNEKDWKHTTAKDVALDIIASSEGMRVIETFCDPTMFNESGVIGVGDIFERNRLPLTPSRNDRTLAGFSIAEWLNTTLADGKPALQIYSPRCPMLAKTLPAMRTDPNHPGKLAPGQDHWTIALAYWAMSGAAGPRIITPKQERESWRKPRVTRKVLGSESVR